MRTASDAPRRLAAVGVLALALAAAGMLSLAAGARSIPPARIIAALLGNDAGFEAAVIADRLPRTAFAAAAGAALGVSGLLMQEITRNPIADPSILGVNSGAALAVVCGIVFLGITTGAQYMALAVAGAAVAAVLVYGVGSAGGGASPLKLALAGTAASTALSNLTSIVIMPSGNAMNSFRFWQVGSVGGAGWEQIGACVPVLAAGIAAAVAVAPSLEVLALGDEAAVGLGARPALIRAVCAAAGVALCGAVTSIAGPISFVGLMVPHLVRLLCRASMRMQVLLCCLGGAAVLLVSDIVGRMAGIAMSSGDLEVGIVTAILGAPVFIAVIVRSSASKGMAKAL